MNQVTVEESFGTPRALNIALDLRWTLLELCKNLNIRL